MPSQPHGRRWAALAAAAIAGTASLAAPAAASAQPSPGQHSAGLRSHPVPALRRPAAAIRALGPHGLGAAAPAARLVPAAGGLHGAAVLPASVDLTPWAAPAGDQGQVNSCVSWAVDYSMLGWYQDRAGVARSYLAPMYTYSQLARGANVGTDPVQTLGVAKTQGVDTQADYTQGNYDYTHYPTAAETANAAHFKITGWEPVFYGANQGNAGQVALEQALAAGKPIAVTIPVYYNFFFVGASNSYYAGPSGPLEGYHEITALGYNSQGLVIENSWSSTWGKAGFATLSWAFVDQYMVEALTVDGLTVPAAPTVSSVAPAAGPAAGGTTVTVTGQGLGGTSSVLFGKSASPQFAVNAAGTSLTAVVPAAATAAGGPVSVTVVSGYSSATTAGSGYTYFGTPTVTGISPNLGPLSGGQPVVISGTNLGGATGVRFGTLPAASFTVNAAGTQISALSPASGSATAAVTVLNPGGSGGGPAASSSYTWAPAPAVSALSYTTGPTAGGASAGKPSTLVISGTNLSGTTRVDFGANELRTAQIVQVSPTSVTVVVPPATKPGTIDVTVTTPAGVSAAATGDRYSYQAAPSVTSVSPNRSLLAGGTTVTVTGTNLIGASVVYLGAVAATPVSVSADGTRLTVIAPRAVSAGTAGVTVVTPGGTSPAVSGVSFTWATS